MAFSAPRNVMVIGLGGTGKWVLTYLKKSLIEASNDYLVKTAPVDQGLGISRAYFDERYNTAIPDGIRLLSCDLDQIQYPALDGGAFHLNYDPTNSQEFVSVSQNLSPLVSRVQGGESVPEIGSWLEQDDAQKMIYGETRDFGGAGLQRQYTRACLLSSLANPGNPRKLHFLIDQTIAGFQQRLGINPSLPTYFFIVGSLAGGTGSGSFLDIAQIVRHRYTVAGLPNTKIFGIFVLSNAFNLDLRHDPEGMRKAKGNTFAAMRELRRFMLLHDYGYAFDEFGGNFKPAPPLTDHSSPFNMCMFLDGTGYTINDSTAEYGVHPAIADFLLTYCTVDAIVDPANLLEHIGRTGAPYSTFGIHSILYPVEDVIQTYAHKLALELQDRFLLPMSPEYNMQQQLEEFFVRNQKYYGQNSPINPTTRTSEFIIGDETQHQTLKLLNEVWQRLLMRQEGDFFDLDYYITNLELPRRFKNTGNRDTDFDDLNLRSQMNSWGMPVVNIDLTSREEYNDALVDHGEIANAYSESGQQKNVVGKVNQLCDINLGTNLVPAYRKGSTDYKSYHGVMKYYQERIQEIYDGYDADGVHFPGLLENILWTLLNENVGERDVMDTSRAALRDFYRTSDLREGVYRFRPGGLEIALQFCNAVSDTITTYRRRIDAAHQAWLSTYTGGMAGLEREVEEVQHTYEQGSFFLGGKARKYFDKKQQWLEEKRKEIVHSYFMKILDSLVQITEEWKATLDGLKQTIQRVKGDIELSRQNLDNLRREKTRIKVRTYLSEPGDQSEEILYTSLMSEPVEKRQQEGNVISIQRRQRFFESVSIKAIPDSSPGNKTGRAFIPDFTFDEHQPDLYTKEDALKNALPYCNQVRDQNFWKLIQEFQDRSDASRYKADANNRAPQLVTDLSTKTVELVAYHAESTLGYDQQRNTFCYANWQTGSPGTPEGYSANLHDTLNQPSAPILSCYDVKTAFSQGDVRSIRGQGHKLIGLRVTNLLRPQSFSEYTTVVAEYRRQIQEVMPKHLFKGEKYAARLEQAIMGRRLALRLNLADHEQVYLHLPLIFALDQPGVFDDFLWAGLFDKLLYERDQDGNFSLRFDVPEKIFLTQGPGTDGRNNLIWALIRFCTTRTAQFDGLRAWIRQTVIEEKNRRSTVATLAAYKKFLDDKVTDTDLINHFVVASGGYRRMIDTRQSQVVNFSAEELLEVVLKVKLLEEREKL